LAELCKLVLEADCIRPQFSADVKAAFGLAGQNLLAGLEHRVVSQRNDNASLLTPDLAHRLSGLRRDGFCKFSADQELADRVWLQTKLERFVLRAKARRSPTGRCVMPLREFWPSGHAIWQAVREKGLLQIASLYLGKPMKLHYASLELTHPKQDWYKDCYADVGIATARTAYMHHDADPATVKAMLYVRDVNSEDAPFSYLRGSHL